MVLKSRSRCFSSRPPCGFWRHSFARLKSAASAHTEGALRAAAAFLCAQQRLWFIDRLEGSSAEYNMPRAWRLLGALDLEALEKAVNTIVERHETLRTHFENFNDEPVQVILLFR